MRPVYLVLPAAALCVLIGSLSWRNTPEGRPLAPPGGEEVEALRTRELVHEQPRRLEAHRRSEAMPELPTKGGSSEARVQGAFITLQRPGDPVELGPCELTLALEDVDTGEALAGRVQLWRLGAPGNASWSAGDQLQATAEVGLEGTLIRELPAGEYRAVCLTSIQGAEDSESFFVGGARTAHTLRIRPPREVEVFLVLHDASGARLEWIELREGPRSARIVEPPSPTWRAERTALQDFVDYSRRGGMSFGGSSHRPWKTVSAGPRGFTLGALLQNSLTRQRSYEFKVRTPELGEVTIGIEELPAAGGHLVGVVMPEEAALRRMILPDGSDGSTWSEGGRVRSLPIAVAAGESPGAWRDSAIEVMLWNPGERAWTRVWRPADGAMTDHWVGREDP